MASIYKRGPGQYKVIIRRTGYPSQTRTFETKTQAEAWANKVQSEMNAGTFRDRRSLAGITLSDSLATYHEKITPTKRGATAERNRIRQLQSHPLAQRPITCLHASDFASYRDQRLAQVSPTSVRLELALLSHLYTIALKEWSGPVVHELR
ncbi:hypothetical protein [Caballeronia sp. LZ032]|uniref:hypothetical protein n=1 Tax=Caballeronia sp. LZ032 TaxID=3038565 RepID=UPI002858CAFF|nr:hypothetical protein [Caballeronia sp. LZ032]MDR5879669.1 hypothetical protein [Caballeronia sp. LZ032]